MKSVENTYTVVRNDTNRKKKKEEARLKAQIIHYKTLLACTLSAPCPSNFRHLFSLFFFFVSFALFY